jgi:RNA polymerase sigma-70 factor (ECF subfamily)
MRAVLTGDANRADDLVQDTLARAWEKRRLWAAGSDLRAWLFTIMHNVLVNQRALARRDQMQVSLDAGGEGSEAWQIPVRAAQYTRVELAELVQHVRRLPVDQREVLLLAAVEELRYEEIAGCAVDPDRDGDVAAVARSGEVAPRICRRDDQPVGTESRQMRGRQ